MFRIVLTCSETPAFIWDTWLLRILRWPSLQEYRRWHKNVRRTWDGSCLVLEAENDYDSNGLALVDEFSDCLCAYLQPFDGAIGIVSVTQF